MIDQETKNQIDMSVQSAVQKATAPLLAMITDLQSKGPDPLIDHEHNGNDATRINWVNIYQKRVYVHHTIQGTAAATATNYGGFWIAPVACYVNSFREVHQTAGSDAGAVTLMLEKLTSGTVPDSGVSVLNATLSLKTTANTPQSGVITTTNANRTLAVGDRLCMKDAGTLTAVANVTVLVEIIVL